MSLHLHFEMVECQADVSLPNAGNELEKAWKTGLAVLALGLRSAWGTFCSVRALVFEAPRVHNMPAQGAWT